MAEVGPVLQSLQRSATEFLRELVEINSHTRNADGVRRNAGHIVRQFAEFGWEAHRQSCSLPGTGEHLVLDSGGTGPVILLVSHLDTVYTPEEQASAYDGWKETDGVVEGPGVYDIKGGTAMLWIVLKALSLLDEEAFRGVRWLAAWNAAEEALPADFAAFCLSLSATPPIAALILEGDNGKAGEMELVSARSGLARFRVTSTGRGAHSGNGHEQGINAIEGLARMVTELSSFTDYGRNTTVNVGVIQGGNATNRVPDFAEALVEVRFSDPAHFAHIRARIETLTDRGAKPCAIKSEMLELIPPLVPSPASERLVKAWQEAAANLGLSLAAGSRRGLSDANFFADHVPTLDGLGPSGGNAHGLERTDHSTRIIEYVRMDSFLPKAALNVTALQALARAQIPSC